MISVDEIRIHGRGTSITFIGRDEKGAKASLQIFPVRNPAFAPSNGDDDTMRFDLGCERIRVEK